MTKLLHENQNIPIMFETRPASELDFHEPTPEWLALSLILGSGI
jgi:hypothetical protein